jgi:hypothetical protein
MHTFESKQVGTLYHMTSLSSLVFYMSFKKMIPLHIDKLVNKSME